MGKETWFEEIEAPGEDGFYCYLLQCADASLYAGWTNNLDRRLKAHNAGSGAKYTKARGPVRLVYYESFADKSQAMKREAAIKKLSRINKEKLIAKI